MLLQRMGFCRKRRFKFPDSTVSKHSLHEGLFQILTRGMSIHQEAQMDVNYE